MTLYTNNGNGNGRGILGELGPLFYILLKGVEASRSATQEYKEFQKQGIFNSDEEMTTQFTRKFVEEIFSKYDLSAEKLLDLIPPSYRGISKLLYSMNWDNVVEIISNIAKEYGKDKETGEYRITQEVIGEAFKQLVRNRIFDEIVK